jgi:hypothetical protein
MTFKIQPVKLAGSVKDGPSPFPKSILPKHNKRGMGNKENTFRAVLTKKLSE